MRQRLYEVDLLRIIAAVAVVVFHYTFSAWMQGLTPVKFPLAGEFSRYGYLGVDLFFVISGFVVLLSAWGRTPQQFVVSRIVRLYPAFWVAVTLTAVVSVVSGKFAVSLFQYLANLTMFNAAANVENIDVVYWTLWAELRFYLVVFVMALIGLTQRRVLLVLWGWLALTGLMELGVLPGAADLLLQTTFSHYFIAGMALGLIYRFGMSWELAAILILSYANAVYRGIGFAADVAERYKTDFHQWVIVGVIWAIFMIMLLVALKATSTLGRPWFSVAGSLTYPLYLVHAHIGFVVLAWLGPKVAPYAGMKWVLVVGLIAVMGVLAYAIHALVERPVAPPLKRVLNRIARIPERPAGQQPAQGGAPVSR
ncbi:peptidoglycan/LPS O-acetylase OafA/YrhL [Micromonospora pisi]|uniref:Peptidoglycan/LPS O-acetylase OafA/YrhL n=1 Tax=Micromonospora pisi TaxID=589240 RepID=A0A495JQ65_9ACTN|nr:acyltransferase [Micromonospora pisi]RKR90658.1 peptidoglycan/LPS O-acetylase OafA/YrhL [Micromonospora pisi]